MAAKKKTGKPGRPTKKNTGKPAKKKLAEKLIDESAKEGRDRCGLFATGNRIWRMRASDNCKPRIFETPADMWQAACRYFDWAVDTPLFETKTFCSQGEVVHADVAKTRAFTIAAMCLHMGMSVKTWDLYRKRPEFEDVVESIYSVIWTQKFEAAAAELLNPMIVAREIGLKDASSHEHTGKDGGPIETADLTDFEKARRIAFYLAQAANQKPE